MDEKIDERVYDEETKDFFEHGRLGRALEKGSYADSIQTVNIKRLSPKDKMSLFIDGFKRDRAKVRPVRRVFSRERREREFAHIWPQLQKDGDCLDVMDDNIYYMRDWLRRRAQKRGFNIRIEADQEDMSHYKIIRTQNPNIHFNDSREDKMKIFCDPKKWDGKLPVRTARHGNGKNPEFQTLFMALQKAGDYIDTTLLSQNGTREAYRQAARYRGFSVTIKKIDGGQRRVMRIT